MYVPNKISKGVHYAGIGVFNQLPTSIRSVANETKVYKKMLKSSNKSPT
jgi:hypothetical protein